MNRTPALAALALAALTLPLSAPAQDCLPTDPAYPVPRALWMPDFRPAPTPRPNDRLPDQRDSTDYITQTIAGLASGHELFAAVDAADDYVFVAYNAGLSVWGIARGPDNPARLSVADGWAGHWLEFPRPGEADSFVTDIAVEPVGDGTYLVATGGLDTVGMSIWRFDPQDGGLQPRYQATGNLDTVATARVGDRIYVLVSGSSSPVVLLDGTAALEGQPCVDRNGPGGCPGVLLGQVGQATGAHLVDLHAFGPPGARTLFAAASRISGLPRLETTAALFAIDDPLDPGAARTLATDYPGVATGLAFFEADGRPHLGVLAALYQAPPTRARVQIFDMAPCLDGRCSLARPAAASVDLPLPAGRLRLQHSADDHGTADPADDEHFMYVTRYRSPAPLTQSEYLVELGRAAADDFAAPLGYVTQGGPTRADACAGEVGYWSWYHPGTEAGLRSLSAQGGVFVGDRFYRVARSVFDVHIRTRPEPEPEPEPEPDMGMEPEPDMGMEPEPDADMQPEPEPDASMAPEPEPEADAAMADDIGPDAPEPEPADGGPDPDAGPEGAGDDGAPAGCATAADSGAPPLFLAGLALIGLVSGPRRRR